MRDLTLFRAISPITGRPVVAAIQPTGLGAADKKAAVAALEWAVAREVAELEAAISEWKAAGARVDLIGSKRETG